MCRFIGVRCFTITVGPEKSAGRARSLWAHIQESSEFPSHRFDLDRNLNWSNTTIQNVPTGKHDQFYPTRLATNLCSGNVASGGDGAMGGAGETRKGFLVLETNYKIYAYTCEFSSLFP
jgi:hypothetical protein